MATKIKDAAVVTSRHYSNGIEKAHWTNIGALYKKDDGSMFLALNAFFNLAALPRSEGSDRVIIGLFDPKKRDDNSGSNNSYSSGNLSAYADSSASNDTGIPF